MQLSKIITRLLVTVFAGYLLVPTGFAVSNISSDTQIYPKNTTTGMFASLGGIPPVIGQVVIGYQFTPNWGVQLGAEGIWGTISGFDLDTVGIYDAAIRGILPLGTRFQLYGKIGLGIIHGEQVFTNPFTGNVYTDISESVGPTFALGLGFCFSPHWMLSIEGNGIYSTGSSLLRDGFKTLPLITITYNFGENSDR